MIALPPLDQSDEFAGTLATTLSAHPRVTAWLATDDVIRRFVVVVDAVASGKSPAMYLGPLRPSGAFRTTERGSGLFADPRNYAALRTNRRGGGLGGRGGRGTDLLGVEAAPR